MDHQDTIGADPGRLVLGVDVGTSGLKATLLDERGATVAEATVGYDVRSPQPGWAEQDPDTWWSSLRAALEDLWSRGLDPARIESIGVTGQMHSLVVLDDQGEVVCPAILWSDQRTGAECDEITGTIGKADLLRQTGNVALTGFSAPKILWIRRHWAEAYARARHFLVTKDFIRYRLTGQYRAEVSDASGMLLLNVETRTWATDVIRALDIDPATLAPVCEGTEIAGQVRAEAAAELGLVAGTPVVGGGGDNAAAAIGLGAVDPGVLTLSIGTSGVIFAPLDRYPDSVDGRLHVFCHALPGRWHLMSVTLAAGGSLGWLHDALAPVLPTTEGASYDWLMERAAASSPGARGTVFLPYISGERTPHADPHARGVFYGLHASTTLDDMVRAVLEGVAFSQREGLDLMRQAGAVTSVLRGTGGGLSSPVWRRIMADSLGVSLQLGPPGMGAARGAAVLAGLGTGMFASSEVGIDWTNQPTDTPDAAGSAALEGPFATYRMLYPHLRPVFARAHD